MVKKIFPFFLVFVLLIIIFSYYQKNNLIIRKILNPKSSETTKSSTAITQPTDSMKKTMSKEKIFLEVDEPKNNITVNNPIINISGKTISNAFIFINEQELKADTNGGFTSATTLEEGENYILIVASDDLGNSIEKDILVNLEMTQ